MPSHVKYELTATIGEYKNTQGETKKRYQRCGTVFENEKGQLSVKLDCVPVSKEWSGFFSCFEPKEQGRDRTASEARTRTPAHSSNRPPADESEDQDSIPF